MANQLNRGRTLVGVATRSSSFVAIKYPNELPNWTTIQFGVLLDVASTAPSSWVALRRILSPTLMLMLLSFRSPRSAWRNGVAAVRPFLPSSWIKSANALTDHYRPAIMNCATSMLSTVISGSSASVMTKFCCLALSSRGRHSEILCPLETKRGPQVAVCWKPRSLTPR
jgi:hypothetical protein